MHSSNNPATEQRVRPQESVVDNIRGCMHAFSSLIAILIDSVTIVFFIIILTGTTSLSVGKTMEMKARIGELVVFVTWGWANAIVSLICMITLHDRCIHSILYHVLPSEHFNLVPRWIAVRIAKLRTVAPVYTKGVVMERIVVRVVEFIARSLLLFLWFSSIAFANDAGIKLSMPNEAHVSAEDIEKFHAKFLFLAAATSIFALFTISPRVATFSIRPITRMIKRTINEFRELRNPAKLSV